MTQRFLLDSEGNLSAESAEAKAALANRPGQFQLARTTPDWICLLRTPAAGGGLAPPRVVLAGDASGFPISDLMAFLGQSRWSGLIRVQSPNGERAIAMKDGEVRGATSDDPADRLSAAMIRLGYVSKEEIEEALNEHPPSKVGRALVEKGRLQAHDLWKCITQQVSDIFQAVVLSREGTFVLIEQDLEEKLGHSIQLSTQSLLMDSFRKIDEMAHFRKRIAHGRMYVARRRPSDGKLEHQEDEILALANGDKSILELAQTLKMSEFDVTKVVFRLMEGGYASLSEQPFSPGAVAPSSPVSVPVEVATPERVATVAAANDPKHLIRVFNRIFKEIRDEVAKRGLDREFIGSANAALANKGLSESPVLQGLSFAPDGSLPDKKLLDRFTQVRDQLGSEPLASLKQALTEVMFFLLFQAGELLEQRADEELSRRVKALMASLG